MGQDGATAITATVRQHFGNKETMKAKLGEKKRTSINLACDKTKFRHRSMSGSAGPALTGEREFNVQTHGGICTNVVRHMDIVQQNHQ